MMHIRVKVSGLILLFSGFVMALSGCSGGDYACCDANSEYQQLKIKAQKSSQKPKSELQDKSDRKPKAFRGVENITEIGPGVVFLEWNKAPEAKTMRVDTIFIDKVIDSKEVEATENHTTVEGLGQGLKYQFKVTAINASGKENPGKKDASLTTLKSYFSKNYLTFSSQFLPNIQSPKLPVNPEFRKALLDKNSEDRYSISFWLAVRPPSTGGTVLRLSAGELTSKSSISDIDFVVTPKGFTVYYPRFSASQIGWKEEYTSLSSYPLTVSISLVDSLWHHILLVSVSDCRKVLYIDGTLMKEWDLSQNAEYTPEVYGLKYATNRPLPPLSLGFLRAEKPIGRRAKYLLDYDIDEISLWTTSLADYDAEWLFHGGSPNYLLFHELRTALSTWYNFEDAEVSRFKTFKARDAVSGLSTQVRQQVSEQGDIFGLGGNSKVH